MNDNERTAADRQEQIEDKAIEWFVKMRGEDAADLHEAFEAWMAEAPEHRRAYEWAEGHFGQSERLKQSKRLGRRRFPKRRTWLLVGAAAAASIALVVALRPTSSLAPHNGGRHVAQNEGPFRTEHGEIRTYSLSDGSKVTLDADSRVEIAMSEAERRLRLRQGKARFAVAPDPRPFVVEAGAGTVEAQEAVFDVGYDDGQQVMVNLVSGKADIRAMMQPAVYTVPAQPLQSGLPIRYPLAEFRPERAADTGVDRRNWPDGWVEYRSVSLNVLIAEANRYADKRIVLDDAAIGRLTASGRFKLTGTETFVLRIAEVFDLKVSHKSDGIHLGKR